MKVIEYVKRGQSGEYVKTLTVVLNPQDNGGESVSLTVDVFDNGDGPPDNIFTNVVISANCYGASSSAITLWSVGLAELANACNVLNAKIGDK